MRKISAIFDGLKYSDSTMEYAVNIAEKSDALLSGIFMESFLYHSFDYFDVVGRQGISATKLQYLLDNDKAKRLQAAETFKGKSEEKGINYSVHHKENAALQALLKESVYSDMLMINVGETMSHFEQKRPTQFIRDLLAETQCPVLVVPDKYTDIKRVVLFYDGGPSSVFAIKMLNYTMPWLKSLETHVIFAVDDENRHELPDDFLVREFIHCHYPNARYTILKGDPGIEIPAYLKSSPANTLAVLGAYQRGAVSRLFKHSMADVLMAEVPLPLFIAHHS